MAHRGPSPLTRKLGRTPNAEWVDVPDVPYEGPSPDLPELADGPPWHDIVVQWWNNLRRMPHCALWRATDWDYALETALLKQRFWTVFMECAETTAASVEIRRREDNMGTTAEALRKLRIRYVPMSVDDDEGDLSEPDEQPVLEHQEKASAAIRPPTSLDERRKRARKSA